MEKHSFHIFLGCMIFFVWGGGGGISASFTCALEGSGELKYDFFHFIISFGKRYKWVIGGRGLNETNHRLDSIHVHY